VPACLVLVFATGYMAFVLAIMLHFGRRHSSTWQAAEPPASPDEVIDPLYRLVSRLRVRMCASGRAHNVMDRDRGEYACADDELEEPARTERLLAQPWLCFRTTPADAVATHQLVYMNRASGPALTGLLYDYVLFAVQLLIAVLYGIGPALTAGTSAAQAQSVAVFCCQAGVGLYVLGLGLSADRIENTVTGWQFVVEGLSTLVLLSNGSASVAANLALLAVFFPLIQKFCEHAQLEPKGVCVAVAPSPIVRSCRACVCE
jgi:hypothetical protein